MKRQNAIPGTLRPAQLAIFLIAPVLCALVCLCVGRMNVPVKDLIAALRGHDIGRQKDTVLWSMRLPRVLLAALVGAGLSVSGCVFQSMFANPLATPDTLGVASGASFGAALALLLGFGFVGVQLTAFCFGLAAVGLTCLMGKGGSRASMILSGIMMGSLFSALVSLVKFTADTESQLPAITYWLMGSLSSIKVRDVQFLCIPFVVGFLPLCILCWRMNLLTVGDEEARAMGVNTTRLRLIVVICATLLTASSVAVSGMIGWVGLVIPHFCRMIFGYDYRRLVPASALFGAAFLIVVDDVARLATTAEIPLGILTAFVGAPIFIYLVLTGGGNRAD